MPYQIGIESRPILFQDDFYAQTAVPATSARTSILGSGFTQRYIRHGYDAVLAAYRMAWDASLDTFVALSLEVNGVALHPYERTLVQLAAPEQEVFLPKFLSLPSGAAIDIIATSSVAGNVTGRLTIYYYDIKRFGR